jgi:hypothetical protein
LSGLNFTKYNSEQILGVWVKAGNNKSYDCPGCGEWFANPAPLGCMCNTSTCDADGNGKADTAYGVKIKNDDNTIFAYFSAKSDTVTVTSLRYVISTVTVYYKDGTSHVYTVSDENQVTYTSAKQITKVDILAGGYTNTLINTIGSCSATPLPVKLISFTARLNGDAANLAWTTASEYNNSHFEIEKSINGIDFTNIGEVQGNGTTNRLHHYQYTDHYPLVGRVYYRLKQVDFNGAIEYSPLVSLTPEVNTDIQIAMNVYPNPVSSSGILKISLNAREMGNVQLTLSNLSGKVMANQLNALQSGENTLELPINNIPAGLYVLRVVVAGQVQIAKIQVKP